MLLCSILLKHLWHPIDRAKWLWIQKSIVYSKGVEDTTQEAKVQIINPLFINVAIMVYTGLEDFGNPNEPLENNHVLTPLAATSTKHNIV